MRQFSGYCQKAQCRLTLDAPACFSSVRCSVCAGRSALSMADRRGVREQPVLFPGACRERDERRTVDFRERMAAVLALQPDRVVSPQRLQISHAAYEIMRPRLFHDRFPDRRNHETVLVDEGDVFIFFFRDPVRHDQGASAFHFRPRPVERAECEILAGLHTVEFEAGRVGRDHGVRDAVERQDDGRAGRKGLREVFAHVFCAGEGMPEILHGERDARGEGEADVEDEDFRQAAFL